MFGCCCSSKNGKTTILAALLTAGITIGGAYYLKSSDSDKKAEPVKVQTPDVVPASFQPEMEMTPEQMMEMMAEWGAPVEEHELLAGIAGSWDCETRFWMEPGAPPMVNQGTSESELILGGRYVTQHFVMPDFMGTEFEGFGAIGYDKQKGAYTNVWIDNYSTSMMLMTGTWDEETKTMTWVGTTTTPMGESENKHIVKTIDEDNTLMEFWEKNAMTGGEFMKTGEITYTRQK